MQLLATSLQGLSYSGKLSSGSSDYLLAFTSANKQTVAAWTTGSAHSVTVLGKSVSISSAPVYVTTESLSLVSSLNPSTYGSPVTFTATVNAPGTTPTGTVTFNNGTATLGSAALNAGVATWSTNNLPAASSPCVITAVYSGDANYASQTTTLGQTVNPLPVVVAGARQYDGTAFVGFGYLSVSNAVSGDIVNLASGYATLAGANAGPEAITSLASLALGGAAAGNYTLTGGAGSVTVTAVPLSITASPASKTYGTALTPSPTAFTVGSGLVGGETVTAVAMTASGGTAATAPVTGSPYTITPGAAAGTNGFLAANYNIAYNAGSLTVNPLPAVLTGTRAYDGTSIALSSILTVSNDISPDVVAVVSGSAPLAGASVGTNVILSAGALQLGGAQAADYTLTPLGGGAVIITNGFNPFSITSAAWDAAGSNLVVCWTSVPGVSYNVLTNHCLAATGSWGDAGAASHPASAVTATDTNTCVAIPVRTIGNTHVYLMIKQ